MTFLKVINEQIRCSEFVRLLIRLKATTGAVKTRLFFRKKKKQG